MSFHEIQFPTAIAFHSTGGPARKTEIVTLGSGYEERNAVWANSRRRYDVGYGVKTLDDLHAVIAFFEARMGRLLRLPLQGFRRFQILRAGRDRRRHRPAARHRRRHHHRIPAHQDLHLRPGKLGAHASRSRSPARCAWRWTASKPSAHRRHHHRPRHLRRRAGRTAPPSPPVSNSTCRCASTPTRSPSIWPASTPAKSRPSRSSRS